ncbi:MAG TPA: zf-TFIIB domain-containing protein [Thermomicrobiales bacterium]|nr:zf-TFIIB domain-containing protein [Thermomicrobiales bacterium]
MKCPIDQTTLQITDRQGIEIDWCPTCRGVWLDRGELDKIIERSGTIAEGGRRVDDDDRRSYYDDDDREARTRYERDPRRRRKRKSFLDDLFDFD